MGVSDKHRLIDRGKHNVTDAEEGGRDAVVALWQVLKSDHGNARRAIALEVDLATAIVAGRFRDQQKGSILSISLDNGSDANRTRCKGYIRSYAHGESLVGDERGD